MADHSMFAPHMIVLGEALKPVLQKVEAQSSEPPCPIGAAEKFRDVAEHAGNQISASLGRLADEVKALNRVMHADTPEAPVHRAVSRLEMVLDELLESYADVCHALPSPTNERDHRLLLAALRRLLARIQEWLRDMVDAMADPKVVLKRRGLPTNGEAKLALVLDIDAPGLAESLAWAIEQGGAEKRSRGFWGGLAAFGVGIFLGGLFFGDDD